MNALRLTSIIENFGRFTDVCASYERQLNNKEIIPYERYSLPFNVLKSIDGKKSLREFADSMKYILEKM